MAANVNVAVKYGTKGISGTYARVNAKSAVNPGRQNMTGTDVYVTTAGQTGIRAIHLYGNRKLDTAEKPALSAVRWEKQKIMTGSLHQLFAWNNAPVAGKYEIFICL